MRPVIFMAAGCTLGIIAGLLFATLCKSPMTEEYIAQAVFGCVGGAALGGVGPCAYSKEGTG